jgi:hypothetical protein
LVFGCGLMSVRACFIPCKLQEWAIFLTKSSAHCDAILFQLACLLFQLVCLCVTDFVVIVCRTQFNVVWLS